MFFSSALRSIRSVFGIYGSISDESGVYDFVGVQAFAITSLLGSSIIFLFRIAGD